MASLAAFNNLRRAGHGAGSAAKLNLHDLPFLSADFIWPLSAIPIVSPGPGLPLAVSGTRPFYPDKPAMLLHSGPHLAAQFPHARANPTQGHALLCARAGGGYTVSVRAPREGPDALRDADGLCRLFEGGSRPAAASISHLPGPHLDAFIREFETAFGPGH